MFKTYRDSLLTYTSFVRKGVKWKSTVEFSMENMLSNVYVYVYIEYCVVKNFVRHTVVKCIMNVK